jgi:hypothetical protein
MAGTPYLVDSNILLRWIKPDHNDYPLVVSAIDAILQRDGELFYTSQNVGEFWNTCTRPLDRNGYPGYMARYECHSGFDATAANPGLGSIEKRNHGREANTRGEESERIYTHAPPG